MAVNIKIGKAEKKMQEEKEELENMNTEVEKQKELLQQIENERLVKLVSSIVDDRLSKMPPITAQVQSNSENLVYAAGGFATGVAGTLGLLCAFGKL